MGFRKYFQPPTKNPAQWPGRFHLRSFAVRYRVIEDLDCPEMPFMVQYQEADGWHHKTCFAKQEDAIASMKRLAQGPKVVAEIDDSPVELPQKMIRHVEQGVGHAFNVPESRVLSSGLFFVEDSGPKEPINPADITVSQGMVDAGVQFLWNFHHGEDGSMVDWLGSLRGNDGSRKHLDSAIGGLYRAMHSRLSVERFVDPAPETVGLPMYGFKS